MDHEIERLIDVNCAQLNPLIANGLAVTHLQEAEVLNYIDSVFRSAARGFPEGLTYAGWRRCTPMEELNEASRKKGNNKRMFDVAVSYLYMVKYFFNFKGKEIVRYMYLPFVSEAGSITISGSRFFISPVLSDRVISVGTDTVFVRLLRDVLTFERVTQNFNVNGHREQANVAWAMIYHKSAKMRKIKPTVRAHSTMVHYLFCKYGLMKTFEMFAQCTPILGGKEINEDTYPSDQWVVCSSTQVKPKGFGRGLYEPSTLRIAVKRVDYERTMVRNMIAGLFYVVDHFPTRVKPEYVNNTLPQYMDNTRTWIILMGHVLFSGNLPEGRLADDVEDHIRSLDEYIDSLVLKKFIEIGIPATDLYQFFGIIIEKITDWLFVAADKVNSMYDKELSILYFVLKDITTEIFKLYFKLKAASKKELTEKDIVDRMNKTISTGLIFRITKQHNEVTTIASSGDNKALKITNVLVPQSSSSRQGNLKERANLNDPTQFLHVSFAEVGGYSNLPKSAPTGGSRINQRLKLDHSGLVLRDPRLAPMLDRYSEDTRRKR
ncbi:hypothetical protein [Paraburkholderia sp. BCC1886]|uniref:hypothetical protein n=1 Tax=Paraburkholderia sp. BCC1886 TaxID=2562670 RepID=UPI001182EC76|nr:hypothetical protein [Paraburkholderia sp. BCC1886]